MNAFQPPKTQASSPGTFAPNAFGDDSSGSVTPEEVEAITKLYFERDVTLGSGVRVQDVAEALRISDAEVERLLAEVRMRKNYVPRRTLYQLPLHLKRAVVFISAAVLCVTIFFATLILTIPKHSRYMPPSPVPSTQSYHSSTDAAGQAPENVDLRQVPVILPDGTYQLAVDEVVSPSQPPLFSPMSPNNDFLFVDDLTTQVEKVVASKTKARVEASFADIVKSMDLIAKRKWDGPQISHMMINVMRSDQNNVTLKLGGYRMPLYLGNDAGVDALFQIERRIRVREIAKQANKVFEKLQ